VNPVSAYKVRHPNTRRRRHPSVSGYQDVFNCGSLPPHTARGLSARTVRSLLLPGHRLCFVWNCSGWLLPVL